MIEHVFSFALAVAIAIGAPSSIMAKEKKNDGSGIIKTAVASYIIYKVYTHHKDKKKEQKAKSQHKESYKEPVYYNEECEDEDECEEE